jgi:hypothetical protein
MSRGPIEILPPSRVPRAGEWAGRGIYYRIDLEGYQELEPKPRMQEVEAGLSDFILDELATLEPHHYPYMKYGDGFRGRRRLRLRVRIPKPETAIAGDFAEGERQSRRRTFFKRNPKLRREAIRRHGAICIACGFNFEKRYGEAGKGYIEIHRLNPLAERFDAASGEPIRTKAEDGSSFVHQLPPCGSSHAPFHDAGCSSVDDPQLAKPQTT